MTTTQQEQEKKVYDYLIKKGLKESSIKVYINNWKRISREVFNIPWMTEKEFQEVEEVYNFLMSDKVILTSKKTILNGLLNVSKALYRKTKERKQYKKYFKEIASYVDEEREYVEPNEKEKENYMTFKELRNIRDKYKSELATSKDPLHFMKYVILCLYTMLPPLRQQDFTNTLLIHNTDIPDNQNYMNLKTKKLILIHHKSAKTHGTREIKIPDELNDILIDYRLNEDPKSQKKVYLVHKRYTTEEPLESSSFTRLFNTLLGGKKVSSSMLRKIFISQKLDEDMSRKERKFLSKQMGHKSAQQVLTYSKFSEKLKDKPEE